MPLIHLALIDRDGVINKDLPTSVRSIREFQLLPRVAEAIRLLNTAGIPVAVITNQALVGRGDITEGELDHIHQHMQNLLAQEKAFLDDIFYCTDVTIEPHMRRKPAPGMLVEAMEKYECLAEHTVMIGDALRDIQAAHAANCNKVLVKTGKGLSTLNDPAFLQYDPVMVYEDLYDAVHNLLAR